METSERHPQGKSGGYPCLPDARARLVSHVSFRRSSRLRHLEWEMHLGHQLTGQ